LTNGGGCRAAPRELSSLVGVDMAGILRLWPEAVKHRGTDPSPTQASCFLKNATVRSQASLAAASW
jgi:hypothetical protein